MAVQVSLIKLEILTLNGTSFRYLIAFQVLSNFIQTVVIFHGLFNVSIKISSPESLFWSLGFFFVHTETYFGPLDKRECLLSIFFSILMLPWSCSSSRNVMRSDEAFYLQSILS